MSAAANSLVSTPESSPVPLEGVERELTRQLHQVHQPCEQPVLRAHLSNLVIFCKNPERAAEVEAAVPGIVVLHPARVLFLIGDAGPGDDLTATVRVHCHRVGDGRTVSSEQITLRAQGTAVERLPFAVRALILGDLPINVWWAVPEPPPLGGPLLYELSEYAQQIIYDSLGWPEPVRGVVATASWLPQVERGANRHRWRVVSDLNWRRLKDWRRILAQALDPATAPGALNSITEVVITHGPHAVVRAWELASWLATSLGWQPGEGKIQPGVELDWLFTTPGPPAWVCIRRLSSGPSNIRGVRIACAPNGKPGALNLTLEDESRIAVLPEEESAVARTLTASEESLVSLIGRQLSNREGDPAFHASMALARVLGQKIVGGRR